MASTRRRPSKAKPGIGKELKHLPQEPLLPVEKRLIAWSLGLGGVFLIILVVLTETLFP